MKISVLSSNLANNCLGRAFILAQALSRHHEVEIVGPTYGRPIWPPCDTDEVSIKPVDGFAPNRPWSSIKTALEAIGGDVTYAVKPLLASYGVALSKRLVSGTPVVLDIDDWQLGFTTKMSSRLDLSRVRARLSGLRTSPNSYYWVALMEKLIPRADDITTVSSFLNRRYGGRGVIVPHGRDPTIYDPRLYDRTSLRREHGIDRFKIIMFLGTAHPHKGIEDILPAVTRLQRNDIRIVLVGTREGDPFVDRLSRTAGGLIIPMGMIAFRDVPRFLSMADLVVLPQKRDPKTEGQIPAKLIDAMAMARPIIATNVSDIGQILQGCGQVIDADDSAQLEWGIEFLLDHPDVANEMGRNARERFLADYSYDTMERRLLAIFAKYANASGTRSS